MLLTGCTTNWAYSMQCSSRVLKIPHERCLLVLFNHMKKKIWVPPPPPPQQLTPLVLVFQFSQLTSLNGAITDRITTDK